MASIVNSSANIASGGTFTAGAGSNRLVVIVPTWIHTTGTRNLTALTHGTANAVRVGGAVGLSAQFPYTDIWLVAEASIVEGAQAITPTYNGGPPTTQRFAAFTLQDCDQTDFSVIASDAADAVTSLTAGLTSTDTSVVIAGVCIAYNASNTDISWTGATELAGSDTTHGAPSMRRAVASKAVTTGAAESVVPSWAVGVNGALFVALFKNFAAGGDVSVALTGQALTSARGSFGPATDKALAGSALTSAQGAATPETSLALSGQALSGSTGNIAPDISIALTGLGATFAQGTLSPALALTLTGASVTLSQGVLSAPGNITVALTGQLISSAQGSLGPANATALTGLSATTAAGAMVAASSVALTGASLTASGGSLETTHLVSLAGSLATLSQGSLLITSGDPTPDALRRVTVTLSNAVTAHASHSVNVSGPPSGVTVH